MHNGVPPHLWFMHNGIPPHLWFMHNGAAPHLWFIHNGAPPHLWFMHNGVPPHLWFMHNGVPPHFLLGFWQFMDNVLAEQWLGQEGQTAWPASSSDTNPLHSWPRSRNSGKRLSASSCLSGRSSPRPHGKPRLPPDEFQ